MIFAEYHKHEDGTIYSNIITAEGNKIYVNGTEAVYESDMYNLPAGNYCLAEDIDADTIINASAEIDLCLCGYTLSTELRMSGGGTINDCTDNGSITNFWGFIGDITLNGGTIISGIGIGNNETFTVNGGAIDGLINVGYNATLILNDGKLTNSGEYSVVQITDGTVKVNGGEVENDDTGIFNYCGNLHITGGSIKSTESSAIYNDDGEFYLSGSPVIEGYETDYADIVHDYSRFESVYAHSEDGNTAYSGSALTFMFAVQDDYADGYLAIAGVDDTTEDLFILLGNENYKLVRGTDENADNLVLHEHNYTAEYDETKHWSECDCSDKKGEDTHSFTDGFCVCGVHKHEDGTILMPLTTAGGELTSGNYYLADNLTATEENITIPSGADVTLCLNGKTLDSGDRYYIINNGTLTLCDCAETKGKITSNNDYAIVNSDTIYITNGTVTGKTGIKNEVDSVLEISDGATVTGTREEAVINAGTFKMTGGTINATGYSDAMRNSASGDNRSTAIISGGTISSSSGIYNGRGCTLTISGNTEITASNGDGITNFGTVTMLGGSITGTTNGIYNYYTSEYSKAVISGGTVKGARGIYNYPNCTVEISGTAEIIGTSTENQDYAIYNRGILTVSGGTVTGRKAICVESTGTITVEGTALIEGTGTGYYDYGIETTGTAEIKGGTIKGAAAIYSSYDSSTDITGGIIIGAHTGVETSGSGSVTISGGNISGPLGVDNSGTLTVLTGAVIEDGIFNYCGMLDLKGGSVTCDDYYAIENYDGEVYISGEPVLSGKDGEIIHKYRDDLLIYAHDYAGTLSYEGDADIRIALYEDSQYVVGNAVVRGFNNTNKGKFVLVGNDDYKFKQGTATDEYTGEPYDALVVGLAHRHNWSADWTSDATAHWHECTADDCDITENSGKDSYAAHTPNADDGDCTTEIKCSICQAETTAAKSHSYTYTASGAVITEKCGNAGCTTHNETAEIIAPTGSLVYDGTAKEATVTYSSSWQGGTLDISYNDNINAGAVTASITKNGASASVNYTIANAVQNYGGGGGGATRYTIEFDSNDGSEVDSLSIMKNNRFNAPNEPTKEGYVFEGWYTDKEFTNKYNFNDKVVGNITLYAKWVQKEDNSEKEPETDNEDTKKWNPFIDVTEIDWFHDVIKEAYLDNIVNGTSLNTFSPNGDITRGMFVTILYRAEGEPAAPKMNFTDIASGEYYTEAVAWAYANGIVKGISDTKYAPDDNITREQLAAILFRYAQYKGVETMTLAENLGQFTDSSDITEYAVSALNWAVGTGVMSGKLDNVLDPLGNATRAEATAMLVRLLNLIK